MDIEEKIIQEEIRINNLKRKGCIFPDENILKTLANKLTYIGFNYIYKHPKYYILSYDFVLDRKKILIYFLKNEPIENYHIDHFDVILKKDFIINELKKQINLILKDIYEKSI